MVGSDLKECVVQCYHLFTTKRPDLLNPRLAPSTCHSSTEVGLHFSENIYFTPDALHTHGWREGEMPVKSAWKGGGDCQNCLDLSEINFVQDIQQLFSVYPIPGFVPGSGFTKGRDTCGRFWFDAVVILVIGQESSLRWAQIFQIPRT